MLNYENEMGQSAPRQESFVPSDVPNHLVWAILSTIFCCQPFGIVAIVYAAQVNSHMAAGNFDAAEQASSTAQKWCLAAMLTGLGVGLIYMLISCVGGAVNM